ncbi:MAG TPA: DNA ligase D [Gammaproteobacteria bacterium]|nr:DNA ligase D [Gammaproteobacteria bacterium]
MRRRAAALEAYRRRRDFTRTPEPGDAPARAHGARFVVQKHAARRLHYDFRLELDGVLKSWAVTRGPSLRAGERRLAMRTEDHPLAYAEFEGVIPAGNYGAGAVLVWDTGEWEALDDAHAGLARGHLRFVLHGRRLRGRWSLIRMGPARAKEAWLLVKADDAQADASRDVLREDTSVASGRTLSEIAHAEPAKKHSSSAAKPPAQRPRRQRRHACPGFVEPALATLVTALPGGKEWIYETKYDGYRALLAASGAEVHVYTRNGLDWTARFANLAAEAAAREFDGALIDGEIVVADAQGRSSFHALQRALSATHAIFTYQAFDLLQLAGRSLRELPLLARKTELARLLDAQGRPDARLRYADHVADLDLDAWRGLCASGFEGLIAKRARAPYRSGRGRDWLKIKCRHDEEYVLGGYCPSARGLPFASVLLGRYGEDGLHYAGRAGSGLDAEERRAWLARFRPLQRARSPFVDVVPAAIARGAVWLEPTLVAQVHSAGETADGRVRQGSLRGLREDKPARSVRKENAMDEERAVDIAGVRITHASRPVYATPPLSKREVAEYLARVAPRMLPHVGGRLLSLLRCPGGAHAKCFYQRHPAAAAGAAIRRYRDGEDTYLYIEDARGLLELAQANALEFHPWGSRVDRLEQPERLVFDLDPDEALPFAEVREAAAELREVLLALGLAPLPMLSGGKGVHVIAPLERRHAWPTVKAFARGVAERLAAELPARYVAVMSKSRRRGRIFVDYLRNERAATAIAPYSPRARSGAPIAWPLSWRALATADSAAQMTIRDLDDRALRRRDPWVAWEEHRRPLRAAALRAVGVELR